jgi:hypothetical protein
MLPIYIYVGTCVRLCWRRWGPNEMEVGKMMVDDTAFFIAVVDEKT